MINLLNIECNRLEFLRALKKVNRVLPKSKKAKEKTVLELMIKKNGGEIRHPDMSVSFECTANGVVKLFIPFAILQTVVQNFKVELFVASFEDGLIYLNEMTIRSKLIRLEEPGTAEGEDAAFNFSKLQLLAFRKIYHQRELERKNLLTHLEREEETLMKNVAKAEDLLKDYGITSELIYSVIDSKMKQMITDKTRVN